MQVRHEPLLRRAWSRRLLALVAVMATAFALVTPTAAASETAEEPELELPPFVTVIGQYGKWTKFEAPTARVYGNADGVDGFVAITGGDLTNVCENDLPPMGKGRFRQTKSGDWIVKTLPGGQWTSVTIYKSDLDVFEFFGQQCPLYFEGDPAFAQPFATGIGVLRIKETVPELFPEYQPPGIYRNSFRGWAVDDNGATYRVRTLADYTVDEPNGAPNFNDEFVKVRKIG